MFNYFKRWDIIHNSGYQTVEPVSSTITTKVKGLGYINSTHNESIIIDSNTISHFNRNYRLFDVTCAIRLLFLNDSAHLITKNKLFSYFFV